MESQIISCNSTLLNQAQNGNESAFDELTAPYRSQLERISMRMLGNTDDATDAAQETLVRAFIALPKFDVDREMGPWLRQICQNICRDLLRSRKVRYSEPIEDVEGVLCDPQINVSGRAEETFTTRELLCAIDRLPSHFREVVLMKYIRDMEVADIAIAVGKPEGTVKCWLFRARQVLMHDAELRSYVMVA